jgi:hypothetical protein
MKSLIQKIEKKAEELRGDSQPQFPPVTSSIGGGSGSGVSLPGYGGVESEVEGAEGIDADFQRLEVRVMKRSTKVK